MRYFIGFLSHSLVFVFFFGLSWKEQEEKIKSTRTRNAFEHRSNTLHMFAIYFVRPEYIFHLADTISYCYISQFDKWNKTCCCNETYWAAKKCRFNIARAKQKQNMYAKICSIGRGRNRCSYTAQKSQEICMKIMKCFRIQLLFTFIASRFVIVIFVSTSSHFWLVTCTHTKI